MNSDTLVSIIIPAYNADRYIGRALSSAIKKNYQNIEIIVVDDGSTDKTKEVVASFKDGRIRYLYQENKFQGAARNYGIKESRGAYVTFLDADDEYFPEKVEKQAKFLNEHHEYSVVYCNALHFYTKEPKRLFRKSGDFPSGNIFQALLRSSLINPNTAMIRREVFDKVSGFNETRYWPEEWDLWLKIAQAGFKFGYLNEDLVRVEIREGSNTTLEIQPILKRYTLKMFEELFAEMTTEERKRYDADKVLQELKIKLAVTHIANGKKKEFMHIIAGINSLVWRILGLLIFIAPSFLLAYCFKKIWNMRQRQSFILVKNE